MKAIKLVVAIAITVAVSTALTMKSIDDNVDRDIAASRHEQKPPAMAAASRRASRFLAEEKNPRAEDHCRKDNEICYVLEAGKNSTCCNNKCVDLAYDRHNCGACKNKCKFTSTCCGGECVNLSYDKRHCGECNKRCMPGGYCIYGMCDYA